jgi:hypothetical protein
VIQIEHLSPLLIINEICHHSIHKILIDHCQTNIKYTSNNIDDSAPHFVARKND